MNISQDSFYNEIPSVADHLLPDGHASLADSCNTETGELRAFRAPEKIEALSITACASIYKYNENDNAHWIASENVRHYCKSPISGDQYERVYYTGEAYLRFFANDNISGGGFDPTVDHILAGIPAPTAAPTVVTTGGGAVYKGYVYAYVNSYGDEGPPSSVGSDSDYNTGSVAIEDIVAAPAGRAINRIRLYRTNSGSSGAAEFQFALDARWFDTSTAYAIGDYVIYLTDLYRFTSTHAAGAWNAGHVAAGDAVTDANLLAVYPKMNYDPPPDGLTNLISLADGSFAGFVGNIVYRSEPFHPNAWPAEYQIPLDITLVGIAADRNTITAGGNGVPFTIYGSHPSNTGRSKASEIIPMLNTRGIASGNGGVFFTSRKGIFFSDGTSFTNMTSQLIDSATWDSYSPDTLTIYWYNRKLFAFDSTTRKGFFIDFNRSQLTLSTLSTYAHTAVSDDDGKLYVVLDDTEAFEVDDPPADIPLCISEWEGSEYNYIQYTYRSRVFHLPYPTNLSALYMVIDSDAYDAAIGSLDLEAENAVIFAAGLTGSYGDDDQTYGEGFEFGGDEMLSIGNVSISPYVTFRLYGDGVLRSSKTISPSNTKRRLPAKYLADKIYFELSGYIPIRKVSIATSMDEL